MDNRYRNQLNKEQMRSLIAELRRELVLTKKQLAYSHLRLKQEPCDTALAASRGRSLHSLCRRIINRKGAKYMAKALLEEVE